MTAADTLRGMVAPGMVQAVNAGADALDQVVRLEATVAGLETTRDDLTVKLAAALERIAELEALIPQRTVFSVDISSLGADGLIADATKIATHKTLYGVDSIQNVRVFLGSSALSWNTARLKACGDKDSVLISITKRDRVALRAFLAATPEKFRQRPGQVKLCYKHECEAEWAKAGKTQAWLDDYYAANLELAEELDASPVKGQSRDHVVKILLWYSQHLDRALIDTMDRFHGGQQFGVIGMDCYHAQQWGEAGRYATAEELFGKLVAFGESVGLPVAVPEWGGEIAKGDAEGLMRAQAIREGGAYLNEHGVLWANWWCATGSKDAKTGLPRDHHLDKYPSNVAALGDLMTGA